MKMADFALSQQQLREQLAALTKEEEQINADLNNHINSLLGKAKSSGGNIFDSTNIGNELQKIENFDPIFESVIENAKKMAIQVEECKNLSDRLSGIVLKLDNKQMRAQHALACTEDILNLKECKYKIMQAVEEKNLAAAVSYIRQVHEIDESAAKSSEDYDMIVQKEKEVKELVRAEFQSAITESNTTQVMQLCPLLQTLGLEVEARDNFLTFMEEKVFIGVSADAYAIEGATDPSAAYAQALLGVFNSTYLILQQYLPMVIQGLENSLGDIYFIRKLHKKCEKEAGLILKRYMKFRGVRDIIGSLKNTHPQNAANLQSDLHSVMDELALLIQYCCKYSHYLKQVCQGAESKVRGSSVLGGEEGKTKTESVVVFAGQMDFDKMVDELVNKYYMEGEQWLLRHGVMNTLPKLIEEGSKLDECFFVLQKCGLRSLATNNIPAACAILNYISDIISNDLLNQANDMIATTIVKATAILQEHMALYRKKMLSANGDGNDTSKANSLYGLSGAMSLASTLAGGVASSQSNNDSWVNELVFHESGGFTIAGRGSSEDGWGTAGFLEAFNLTELCARYSDRLSHDLYHTSLNIFEVDEESTTTKDKKAGAIIANSSSGSKTHPHTTPKHATATNSLHHTTTTAERLKLCKDNLDACKIVFNNALRQGLEKLVNSTQSSLKDIFYFILSRNGIYGGLRFEEKDHLFDQQPILVLLPKILTVPFETIVSLLTSGLSEKNKDFLVGLLADSTSEKMEAFLNQNTFSLAGALKMEEIVRALSSLYAKHASSPIRGKFSRLREIMMVLTAENYEFVRNENFTNLTANEVEAFFGLRINS